MSVPLVGPKCRNCRREKQKLFLKGEKCFTPKCPVVRRAYAPGMHGQATFKLSEYGRQLREKQKIRRSYGITERQLSNTFVRAAAAKGMTGTKLLELLELRLDNVVYRAGFAASRSQARQLVNHGHFRVNGKRLDIPSYMVRMGDVITIREGSQKKVIFAAPPKLAEKPPVWLESDGKKISIASLPSTEELERLGFQHQMVVEFYSR